MSRRRIFAPLVVSVVLAACGSAPHPERASPGVEPGSAGLRVGDRLAREVYPFEVRDAGGEPREHPMVGGFDVPRPQLVDIDGDDDLDLFVQERTDRLIFFENVGGVGRPTYRWRTDRFQGLDIGEWSRFADLDHDGDLDLLAETPFSLLRVYLNEGSAVDPRFTLAVDTLEDADGVPVFSDRQNIPSTADVDCDGRTDLFLGRVDGTVTRYEEVDVVDGVPVFELVTDRFQDIEIVAALSVPGEGESPLPTVRHGANSMFFADADGDGDPDLWWGDYFEAGVLFIENFGSCARPDLRSEPVPVPAQEEILTSGYNAPYLVDADADGDLDLFIGVLGGAFNPTRTAAANLHFHRRGPDGRMTRVTERYLDQVDLGSESAPATTDLDGDGDLDLVVGHRVEASGDGARLFVYENTGSPRAPDFALRDTVRPMDGYHFSPRFADLDGDGRDELLLGTWNDDVHLFRDVARARAPREADAGQGAAGSADWITPRWERVGDGPLVELSRGSHSVPAPGDLDGDGDLDLLVGESSGEVNFFRNVGESGAPRFEPVTDALDGMDVGRRSHPFLIDLDGDGDLDLLLGREGAGVEVRLNEGGATGPRFGEARLLEVDLPPLATPAPADLDGDGDVDLLSGTQSGGLVFLRNERIGG
jgi:hypothetical protein